MFMRKAPIFQMSLVLLLLFSTIFGAEEECPQGWSATMHYALTFNLGGGLGQRKAHLAWGSRAQAMQLVQQQSDQCWHCTYYWGVFSKTYGSCLQVGVEVLADQVLFKNYVTGEDGSLMEQKSITLRWVDQPRTEASMHPGEYEFLAQKGVRPSFEQEGMCRWNICYGGQEIVSLEPIILSGNATAQCARGLFFYVPLKDATSGFDDAFLFRAEYAHGCSQPSVLLLRYGLDMPKHIQVVETPWFYRVAYFNALGQCDGPLNLLEFRQDLEPDGARLRHVFLHLDMHSGRMYYQYRTCIKSLLVAPTSAQVVGGVRYLCEFFCFKGNVKSDDAKGQKIAMGVDFSSDGDQTAMALFVIRSASQSVRDTVATWHAPSAQVRYDAPVEHYMDGEEIGLRVCLAPRVCLVIKGQDANTQDALCVFNMWDPKGSRIRLTLMRANEVLYHVYTSADAQKKMLLPLTFSKLLKLPGLALTYSVSAVERCVGVGAYDIASDQYQPLPIQARVASDDTELLPWPDTLGDNMLTQIILAGRVVLKVHRESARPKGRVMFCSDNWELDFLGFEVKEAVVIATPPAFLGIKCGNWLSSEMIIGANRVEQDFDFYDHGIHWRRCHQVDHENTSAMQWSIENVTSGRSVICRVAVEQSGSHVLRYYYTKVEKGQPPTLVQYGVVSWSQELEAITTIQASEQQLLDAAQCGCLELQGESQSKVMGGVSSCPKLSKFGKNGSMVLRYGGLQTVQCNPNNPDNPADVLTLYICRIGFRGVLCWAGEGCAQFLQECMDVESPVDVA